MKLRNLNGFLFGFTLPFLLAYCSLADASGPDVEQETTVITGDQIAGDTIIGDTLLDGDSSKALGLGFSYALGDVDLNEGKNCYVSTAKGNVLFGRQKVELNPWCAALFYDANRKHTFAAVMRCSIETISGQYLNNEECVVDQTLEPMEIVVSPAIDEIAAKFEEADSEREAFVEDIQQQLEEQQQQYEELAAKQSRPRDAQTQSTAELYWTEERRAKLEAIKGEQ